MGETNIGAPSPVANRLPLIALAFVIVAWGAGPVIVKLISVHPLVGVLFRFGLSVPLLFLLLALNGKRTGGTSRLAMPTLRRAALPGLAFGINLSFVFAALQEATVAVLAVTIAIQPALLLIIAGPYFGERPTTAHIGWSMVGIAGAGGVILGAGDELRASVLGVVLALLAMLTFTVYFVLTRVARSTIDVDPFEWMTAINIWAFVAGVPPALVLLNRSHFDEVDGSDLFWLLVLGYLTGVFGHVLMSWVHGYVEAARSSLFLLGMNVVAVGLAWPIHDEPVTVMQAAAGLVVLWAVAAVVRLPASSH